MVSGLLTFTMAYAVAILKVFDLFVMSTILNLLFMSVRAQSRTIACGDKNLSTALKETT